MAGRIPKDFIDQLMTRIDIVEVIQARVPLKKAGREYTACCPFHNEKSPSFTVSPTKQFYHCFGCGAHGTAISFLMDYEHMEYAEAIEALAAALSLEVPREQDAKSMPAKVKRHQDDLFSLMSQARQFFVEQLTKAPHAQHYIQQRGLNPEVVAQYQVGFAPDQFNALGVQFGQTFGQAKLLASGLQVRNEAAQVYDRFRGRLMFPIRNRKGQVIGFGGRVLGDGKPKYLNSPETELFHKGSELYGLYEARQYTRNLERLIVVEGYMDVIALAQFGITYAVATLGTATTSDHIKILFRLVPEIVFCFDGDKAGRNAAWKALETLLPHLNDGREVRFLFLPTGEDPDTQVRKVGTEAFEASIKAALPLTKFFTLGLKENLSLSPESALTTAEENVRFNQEADRLLALMPASKLKTLLVAQNQGMFRVLVEDEASKQKKNKFFKDKDDKAKSAPKATSHEVKKTPVRYAIALLLHDPTLTLWIENPERLVEWDIRGVDLLLKVVETIEENPQIHSAGLLERFRGTRYEAALMKLMAWQPVQAEQGILQREFQDCLRQIAKQARQKAIDDLLHKEQLQGLSEQEKQDLLSLLSYK
ncbi:DNA primase [Thiolinea disciformis]|uniref:DNA primase n=1 Tax=Thiolinea disciformis TaxID=125614 RepID=UPI00035ED296|nr:DNA primase [Thiolinea disciformis]